MSFSKDLSFNSSVNPMLGGGGVGRSNNDR